MTLQSIAPWILLAALLPLPAQRAGCEPAPSAGPPPRILGLAPVGPQVLQLSLRQQWITQGAQIPYVAQAGDVVTEPDPPDNPHRYVTRDGEAIGALVGPDDALLWTFDTLEGPTLDALWLGDASHYQLTSETDPAFAFGVRPDWVSRKTKGEGFAQVGPDQRKVPLAHEIFLGLPLPLSAGHAYTLTFEEGAFEGGTLVPTSLVHAPLAQTSPAVHVSQVGFAPGDPHKLAFLSTWMGTRGPLPYPEGLGFSVVDTDTGAPVLTGSATLQRAATEAESGSKNATRADVYQLDFSALSAPGTYRVCAQDIGCSLPFPIAASAWEGPFRASARALYHARSGADLGPPYTDRTRPRDHHPGDPWVTVRLSTAPLMDTANGLNGDDDGNFGSLVAGLLPEDQTLGLEAWGGYHDAGDWDRRIQHVEASILLLDLMEIFPDALGDFDLGIPPEDGLPDLIAEARSQLAFYRRLQIPSGPDAGAIRGGIEHDAHPRTGEASWQDTNLTIAYAPDPWSSWLYAGASAHLARWLAEGGFASEAALYGDSAAAAMAWAEGEDLSTYVAGDNTAVRDARNFAAAALYRLTGDEAYHAVFKATTIFTSGTGPVYGQRHGAWIYARTERPGVDVALKAHCIDAYREAAEAQRAAADETGFRWAKPKAFVLGLGTFSTVLDSYVMGRAHALTGDAGALEGLKLMVQTGTGANPLNLSYTTGVGAASVVNPLHVDTRMMGIPPHPGITVLGPADESNPIFTLNLYHRLVFSSTYDPPIEGWPILECYHDSYLDPLISEFTVHQTIAPNLFAWGYLAGVGGAP